MALLLPDFEARTGKEGVGSRGGVVWGGTEMGTTGPVSEFLSLDRSVPPQAWLPGSGD